MRQTGGVPRYPLHRQPHLSQRGSVEYRLKVNVDTPVCLVLPTREPAFEDPGSTSTAPVSVTDGESPGIILSADSNCNLVCI